MSLRKAKLFLDRVPFGQSPLEKEKEKEKKRKIVKRNLLNNLILFLSMSLSKTSFSERDFLKAYCSTFFYSLESVEESARLCFYKKRKQQNLRK